MERKLHIVTDKKALEWVYSFRYPDGLISGWIENLGQFDFEVQHEAGNKIPHAGCPQRKLAEKENVVAFTAAVQNDGCLEKIMETLVEYKTSEPPMIYLIGSKHYKRQECTD